MRMSAKLIVCIFGISLLSGCASSYMSPVVSPSKPADDNATVTFFRTSIMGSGIQAPVAKEAAKQTPVFLINGFVEGKNIYCSFCDDFKATYDVTSGFIRRGKKKILFLCDSYSYSASKKMAGYEAALRDAGYPIRGELKFYTKNRIHHVRDMLLSHKNLEFDSVVATDDGLAIGALKYANVKGLKVPDDIEIAGYNNSQLSVGCEPELTSVDNHLEKMCNDTVDYMLRVLQGDTDVPPQNEVVCEIKKRCTTDF